MIVELSRFIVTNSFGKLHTQIQLFFIGGQITQSFVNCSGVLIAEMDATRNVDNDSGSDIKIARANVIFYNFI